MIDPVPTGPATNPLVLLTVMTVAPSVYEPATPFEPVQFAVITPPNRATPVAPLIRWRKGLFVPPSPPPLLPPAAINVVRSAPAPRSTQLLLVKLNAVTE